jgi:hypothetical protein
MHTKYIGLLVQLMARTQNINEIQSLRDRLVCSCGLHFGISGQEKTSEVYRPLCSMHMQWVVTREIVIFKQTG